MEGKTGALCELLVINKRGKGVERLKYKNFCSQLFTRKKGKGSPNEEATFEDPDAWKSYRGRAWERGGNSQKCAHRRIDLEKKNKSILNNRTALDYSFEIKARKGRGRER